MTLDPDPKRGAAHEQRRLTLKNDAIVRGQTILVELEIDGISDLRQFLSKGLRCERSPGSVRA
jgi:hypothetical protein